MSTHSLSGMQYLVIPGFDGPTSSTSSSSGSSNNDGNTNNRRRRSRGLSLSLADMVATTTRNKRNSTGSNHSAPPESVSAPPPPSELEPSQVSVEIEGGQQLIIRPNRIIRGSVVLRATKPIHATQIRVKFRAVEVAMVRVRETSLEHKLERIDQLKRTYFDVDTRVWGNEASDFSVRTWESLEPGDHRFPFALKFPNVNFPPSVDDPLGFSIHYIWTAHVDGAGFQPGLRSREYILPYRPIICAPPPQEWSLSETLYKSDKKGPMARATAVLPQHVFCPDEPFSTNLHIECIPNDLIVTDVMLSLKKHYEGKLQLQQGTAYKTASRNILRSSVSVAGNNGTISIPIQFQMPTRLVSPSFASKHIRVYYSLTFHIQCESVGNSLIIKRPSWTSSFSIPIAIANLPNDHLLRIPDLTSIQSYHTSNEAPLFFDPALEEPPAFQMSDGPLMTPPLQSPPNYFSLPSMPPQAAQRERVEQTSFTSRLIKPGFAPELGEIATMAEVFDDDW
ncbi:hypothetical protein BJV82DRAFT_639877 [Fennellomyces sp. T-0311]|nr:hypothetical protein BJV82DRAFT_639877 [Fennellomyces sp. T-0311]